MKPPAPAIAPSETRSVRELIAADDVARRVVLTRKIIVVNMMSFVLAGVYFAVIRGFNAGTIACLSTPLVYIPWLVALRRGKHMLARMGSQLCSSFTLGFFVLGVGIDVGVQELLLGNVIQPFALFGPQERRHLRVAVIIPLTMYVLLLLFHPAHPLLIAPSPDDVRLIARVNGIVFAALVLSRVSFLFDSNARHEDALLQARDEALAASRVKSQFLANMSHEIRTPLNGVLGMGRLVLDSPLNADQRECLLSAQRSAEGLMQIVNDVLDISKIEAGKLELERVAFSLRRCVDDTLSSQAARAHERELELYAHVDPDVPWEVMGDPMRLRQVLLNLVGNALKFTPCGEVCVRVRRGARPDEVAFAVEDTGVGISQENLAHIFEAFTQADGSTTRRFGGTGLGLTISRELVELMGGRIAVESRLDAGSTFRFTALLPATGAAPTLPPGASRVRCVVHEPHAGARDGLLALLAALGVPAVVVAHPTDALAVVDAHPDADHLILVASDAPLPLGPRRGVRVVRMERGPSPTSVAARARPRLLCPVEVEGLLRVLGAPVADARPSQAPPEASRPLRVLVVEDNAVNARIALRFLERLGHKAEHVGNGVLAVQRAQRRDAPLDVVLMDMQMPELDGLSAARQIRAWESAAQCAPVAIIALTANAMKSNEDECLAAGMDGYLSKPFTPEQLSATLARVTESRDGNGV